MRGLGGKIFPRRPPVHPGGEHQPPATPPSRPPPPSPKGGAPPGAPLPPKSPQPPSTPKPLPPSPGGGHQPPATPAAGPPPPNPKAGTGGPAGPPVAPKSPLPPSSPKQFPLPKGGVPAPTSGVVAAFGTTGGHPASVVKNGPAAPAPLDDPGATRGGALSRTPAPAIDSARLKLGQAASAPTTRVPGPSSPPKMATLRAASVPDAAMAGSGLQDGGTTRAGIDTNAPFGAASANVAASLGARAIRNEVTKEGSRVDLRAENNVSLPLRVVLRTAEWDQSVISFTEAEAESRDQRDNLRTAVERGAAAQQPFVDRAKTPTSVLQRELEARRFANQAATDAIKLGRGEDGMLQTVQSSSVEGADLARATRQLHGLGTSPMLGAQLATDLALHDRVPKPAIQSRPDVTMKRRPFGTRLPATCCRCCAAQEPEPTRSEAGDRTHATLVTARDAEWVVPPTHPQPAARSIVEPDGQIAKLPTKVTQAPAYGFLACDVVGTARPRHSFWRCTRSADLVRIARRIVEPPQVVQERRPSSLPGHVRERSRHRALHVGVPRDGRLACGDGMTVFARFSALSLCEEPIVELIDEAVGVPVSPVQSEFRGQGGEAVVDQTSDPHCECVCPCKSKQSIRRIWSMLNPWKWDWKWPWPWSDGGGLLELAGPPDPMHFPLVGLHSAPAGSDDTLSSSSVIVSPLESGLDVAEGPWVAPGEFGLESEERIDA